VLLNITDLRLHSRVNGPGIRSVIWVQGCTIGCPGCYNPHTHAHRAKHLVDPRDLAEHFLKVDADGLTILGGEPFEQAAACAVLAATYRASGRSVMVFSGYRFEVLQGPTDRAVHDFLAEIDLLIAGPFVAQLAQDVSLWRGSSNQTVHFLTEHLRHAVDHDVNAEPLVEINTDGGAVFTSGFPTDEDRRWLDQLIRGGGETIDP